MSHPDLLEIHDHAYGFAPSDHAAGCAECRRMAEEIRAERDALQSLLRDAPAEAPHSLIRKLSPRGWLPSLAAAAALLAVLVWLFLGAPAKDEAAPRPADANARPAADPIDIDRLISELESTSQVRREAAELALKAYGAAAIKKLEKAKADPVLIDACRGITPADREIMRKLDTMKMDLSFENSRVEDILAFIRDFSKLNLVVDVATRGQVDYDKPITLKVRDVTLREALRQSVSPLGLGFYVTEGVVFVTPSAPASPPASAPIRIPHARRVNLSEGDGDLLRLGFAAEPALWEALGAADEPTRARAARLLRKLYTVPAEPALNELEEKIRATRITIDMQDAPLGKLLEYVGEIGKLAFAIAGTDDLDPDDDIISIKVSGIILDGALRLMLGPRQHAHVAVGDVVLITRKGSTLRTPEGPLWTTAAKAREMEGLLSDLHSGDSAAKELARQSLVGLGVPALGPLLQAGRVWPEEAAGRCRAIRREIAERQGAWLVDEPSGFELQRLSPEQRKALSGTVNATLNQVPLPAACTNLLETLGVPVRMEAASNAKVSLFAKKNPTKIDGLLKALIRPNGLDFYVSGETIVIDTAAKVRAAVEQ